MPPNETPRLQFRTMGPADLDAMAGLLGDPQVMSFYPHPKDRTEAAMWIDWNRRNYAESGHGLWVVETHEDEFIGDAGLTWQSVGERRMLEVGYHVKADLQGLGYATEAASACRDSARSHELSSRLVAIIHEDNSASIRVAQKVGMSLDPTLQHSSPIHEVYAMDL